MYPQINKEQMPSAPPSYSESVDVSKYGQQNFGPGYPANAGPGYPENAGPSYPPPMGSQVPTQVIVVQAPARKCIHFLIALTLCTAVLLRLNAYPLSTQKTCKVFKYQPF